MTIASKDDVVRINVAKDLHKVVFPSAAFSIVNVPADECEARDLFFALYNSPVQRHTMLAFCRHPKRDMLEAVASLADAGNVSAWTYFDTVHVWYEKPSSSSNSAFLPLTEPGYLFHKGAAPSVENTKWFSGGGEKDAPNATNLWNVSPQAGEERPFTYYRKFCWEIPLLLTSMATPLESRRFIYAAEWESSQESLFKFCHDHGMQVQLYTTDEDVAQKAITRYEEMFGANP